MSTDRQPVNTLLVEDDADVAEALSMQLSDAPCFEYRIKTVSAVDRAIVLIRSNVIHVDLVLLDLSFPAGVSGPEAVRAVRNADKNVPLIVITGNSDPDVRARCRLYGADAYITKGNFNMEGLRALIWNALVTKRAELAFAGVEHQMKRAEAVVRQSQESDYLPPYPPDSQDKIPSDDFRGDETKHDGQIPKVPKKESK